MDYDSGRTILQEERKMTDYSIFYEATSGNGSQNLKPIFEETELTPFDFERPSVDLSSLFEEVTEEEAGFFDEPSVSDKNKMAQLKGSSLLDFSLLGETKGFDDFEVSHNMLRGASVEEMEVLVAKLVSMVKEMNERLTVLENREKALVEREQALEEKERDFLKKQVLLSAEEMIIDSEDSEIIIDEFSARLLNDMLKRRR